MGQPQQEKDPLQFKRVMASLGLPGGGSKDLGEKLNREAAGDRFRTGSTDAFVGGGRTSNLALGGQDPGCRRQGRAHSKSL